MNAETQTVSPNRRDMVQSLERGLAVVLAFADHPGAMTVTDLARRTGLSRPVVRRLLITLSELGYVHTEGRQFTLTPRVLRLGYAYLSSQPLVDIAEPHMERLAGIVHESCSLATLDGTEVVLIGRVLTRRVMAVNLEIGTRLPAYASALGRVLLTGLSEARLSDYLATVHMVPLTSRTITDPVQLRAELTRIRDQGWCIVDQDFEEGVRTAAAPVRDGNDQVVAAIGASFHAGRVDLDAMRDQFLPPILQAANAITAHLSNHRGTWRL